MDHAWSKGETCKIVCTQPRRISATSGYTTCFYLEYAHLYLVHLEMWSSLILCVSSAVAERIASERGENIGGSVGYKVLLDCNCTATRSPSSSPLP